MRQWPRASGHAQVAWPEQGIQLEWFPPRSRNKIIARHEKLTWFNKLSCLFARRRRRHGRVVKASHLRHIDDM